MGITDVSNLPKLIELNNDVIQKVSSGLKHSLLLSSDVFIYSFGDNSYGQLGSNNQENESKPVKLIHKNRFFDITLYFDENISFELLVEGIYYFWSSLGIKYYLTQLNRISNHLMKFHCIGVIKNSL
jgi:alpha-tubulin suppressor-like RCC1 family protein